MKAIIICLTSVFIFILSSAYASPSMTQQYITKPELLILKNQLLKDCNGNPTVTCSNYNNDESTCLQLSPPCGWYPSTEQPNGPGSCSCD